MSKLDLKKDLKVFYSPSAKAVQVVEVPRFKFAMIDGQLEAGRQPGDSPEFQEAIQALYGVSYTLKFTSKLRKENPIDYPVMALEGLWWVENGEFDYNRKEDWRWTLMIFQPAHITAEMYAEAIRQLEKKRPDSGPAIRRLRLEEFEEGLSMQILHVGPYSAETVTIEKMLAFAGENGYKVRGKHHEIYMGDPRRAAPEKLKTILRYPIEKA